MTNLQKIQSEVRQRLNTYTISGHEDLPGPIIGETLTAESRPEVEARLTDYLERAAIVAEGEEEALLADEHNRTQKQDCP